jgi:2,3-bisphosphoglycerate-independent phosphoglycerate mutase
VGAVVSAARECGGVAMITADHGNAEAMVDADGATPFTAHTLDPVPLVVVADGVRALSPGGILADVAPTLLDLVGIEAPSEWTGRSLLLY